MNQALQGLKWSDWRGEPFVTVGDPTEGTKRVLRIHARRCADWLLERFAAELEAKGSFHLRLSLAAKEPAWTALALKDLQERPGWTVHTATVAGHVVYRVCRGAEA